MAGTRRQIWIDLDNAPHVPFFAPIIQRLRDRGCEVLVTSSSRHQVRELAQMHGISQVPCTGGYYGKSKILKALGIFTRACHLTRAALRDNPTLALSHGSRSQIIAAKLLGIPSVVIIDYEFISIPIVTVDCLIVPEVIPDSAGHNCREVWKYSGLKEDVYVPGFKPTKSVVEELGIATSNVIATVRPPATDAHYHHAKSEYLFRSVMERLADTADCKIVMLPRSKGQGKALSAEWSHLVAARKVIIPATPICGLTLICESDLVVSGGGTMNREAAALGVPVYSIFTGPQGAVDRYLCSTGRMTMLGSEEDIKGSLTVRKHQRQEPPVGDSNRVLDEIVTKVEALFHAARGPSRR